ncbi:MAG: DUF4352 domain-containing protein [Lachnospiraceae bacterium]|nr:DUF4352 domain-containing protein [Lachnospiraceae bacterium]
MRKKILLLGVCAALSITGCSLSDSVKETVTETVKNAVDSSSQSSEAPAPSATPAAKETKLALGKKGTVGDWDIKVKKVSTTKKIKDGKYRYFESGKGNSFVYLNASARNNGKKAANFLPMVGYENTALTATLYYKGEYEYKPTQLLGYNKDLVSKSVKPLTTKSGVIAFKVPNKVAKAKKGELTLHIGLKNDYLVYSLK